MIPRDPQTDISGAVSPHVTADGQRFLVDQNRIVALDAALGDGPTSVTVVVNWTAALGER
jgi:hypothetical protein